jgi:hypothetical protein
MENKDFAVFLLTHGRPDNVKTIKTLKKHGYTGRVFFIVDNEDKTINKYISNFGEENIIVFDKKYYASLVDNADNFNNRKVITHARNACFDIARKLNITYFIQLDDDYSAFHFRFLNEERNKLLFKNVLDLDRVFDIYLDFFKSTNFKSLAFAQGGDFIGGASGSNPNVFKSPLSRKCMNSFICSTDRPFQFLGTMNEDVNTYTLLGSRGDLFMTAPLCSLVQTATQSQKGGATDWFKCSGTYAKSFYSIMMHPSGVRASMLNSTHPRIHHNIRWLHTVPVIIDEKHKKAN